MINSIQLRSLIYRIIIITFVFTLLLIILRAAYPYITGPKIIGYEYEEKGDMYTLRGTTTRVKILYIQGKETAISPDGTFSTRIIKLLPFTPLIIEARDRFDHRLIIKKDI